uniref:WRKY19-like zinc finger domain-containing protein n=1 Tax=Mucochytrium quahogii TaxID=96639 RepID=A0A7S2RTK3_9STRA|mmetsp:Transcript_19259/g.31636  ORF Transcript_19259/g.31636 Transcript_19259/m.31636 type:complete len:471 (+) Transcript_19259:816-2228(+)|eukprot:CAMPEP_0203774932 /NCGR_PEP_ID=MMETSP0099_2-20121227/5700_1 /ASSEMBLY_ACC=CAM_ASM_000209 /TAXON_ID=96639 /ORGANISM=" , Strain NY0313808BC1" /LENGTH=470 /DNA_ID=CAMNT_0050673353 /DNA_START=559 /DNA_END=1971 /DNA_ORIENTATION=+
MVAAPGFQSDFADFLKHKTGEKEEDGTASLGILGNLAAASANEQLSLETISNTNEKNARTMDPEVQQNEEKERKRLKVDESSSGATSSSHSPPGCVVEECKESVVDTVRLLCGIHAQKNVLQPNVVSQDPTKEEKVVKPLSLKVADDGVSTSPSSPNISVSSLLCQYAQCSRAPTGNPTPGNVFCATHGEPGKCDVFGCKKSAQGRTTRCKAHGGGKRCLAPNCSKSAQGSTDFCKAHGGGKRCKTAGCTKAARGSTDHCIAHGGGKRCVVESCSKSAVGSTPYCVKHGGGRRCSVGGCTKSARGGSSYCAKHGTIERKRLAAEHQQRTMEVLNQAAAMQQSNQAAFSTPYFPQQQQSVSALFNPTVHTTVNAGQSGQTPAPVQFGTALPFAMNPILPQFQTVSQGQMHTNITPFSAIQQQMEQQQQQALIASGLMQLNPQNTLHMQQNTIQQPYSQEPQTPPQPPAPPS